MTEVYNTIPTVDQKNQPPKTNLFSRIQRSIVEFVKTHPSGVILLLGLLVLLEIIWGALVVAGNRTALKRATTKTPQASPAVVNKPSLAVIPTQNEASIGQPIVLTVELATAGLATDGATAVIIYDPVYLTYQSATPGSIYQDYTKPVVNQQAGTITLTGIANLATTYNGDGRFATLTFTPKKAGATQVGLAFTPGASTQSAVAGPTGQLLGSVTGATVSIK